MLNLSNCDREPIRVIGAVQEHGYFFAFRFVDHTIYHASANIDKLLKVEAKALIGKSIRDLLDAQLVSRIEEVAGRLKDGEFETLRVRGDAKLGREGSILELLIYDLDGLTAVEVEEHVSRAFDDANELASSLKRSRKFIEELHTSQSLVEASKSVCRAIRGMTGFDRVMMYRYLPNWDGEVIAEDKTPEASTFLNHRFPASDIPLPARELYLQNRTRQIYDSELASSAIVPEKHYLTHRAIDLTHSKLRAVSPIHLSYLKNMKVRSSFSVAIIVNQQLWGLIACHASQPILIPHEIRFSCETLASTFAVLANLMQELSEQKSRLAFEEKLRSLFQNLRLSESPVSLLMKNHSVIEDAFRASGVALATSDGVDIAGITPPQNETQELADWFKARFKTENKTIISVDSLSSLNEKWAFLSALACGVLAVFSPNDGETVFMIFRPELMSTITWGGDPRKSLQKRDYQGAINPRASFESWTENINGRSAAWTSYEMQGAIFLRDFVFDSLVRREKLIQDLKNQLIHTH